MTANLAALAILVYLSMTGIGVVVGIMLVNHQAREEREE